MRAQRAWPAAEVRPDSQSASARARGPGCRAGRAGNSCAAKRAWIAPHFHRRVDEFVFDGVLPQRIGRTQDEFPALGFEILSQRFRHDAIAEVEHQVCRGQVRHRPSQVQIVERQGRGRVPITTQAGVDVGQQRGRQVRRQLLQRRRPPGWRQWTCHADDVVSRLDALDDPLGIGRRESEIAAAGSRNRADLAPANDRARLLPPAGRLSSVNVSSTNGLR